MPRASGRPPRFFASQAEFRRWLEKNHASRPELWVGFYRKGSGRGGIGYKEAVDEALSFGWIDGLKKRVDAVSYMHRFTPRTRGSIWSAVNLARIKVCIFFVMSAKKDDTRARRLDALIAASSQEKRLT